NGSGQCLCPHTPRRGLHSHPRTLSCGGRFQWCSQVCKSSSAPLGRLLGSTLYRPVDSLLILVDESACHRTDIVSQGAAHERLCAHVLGAELEQTPVRRWSVKTLVWVALLPD